MFRLSRKEIFGSSQSVSSYFHNSGEMASILQDPTPGCQGEIRVRSGVIDPVLSKFFSKKDTIPMSTDLIEIKGQS